MAVWKVTLKDKEWAVPMVDYSVESRVVSRVVSRVGWSVVKKAVVMEQPKVEKRVAMKVAHLAGKKAEMMADMKDWHVAVLKVV